MVFHRFGVGVLSLSGSKTGRCAVVCYGAAGYAGGIDGL